MRIKFRTIGRPLIVLLLLVAGTASMSAQTHYLVFASDRHNNMSATGSTPVVSTAMSCWKDLGVEYVSLVGDMVGASGGDAPEYDVSTVWSEVNDVFPDLSVDRFSIIWADHDAGYKDASNLGVMKVPSTSTSDYGNKSTHIYTGPDNAYYIYAINYYEMLNATTAEPEAFKQWVDGIDKGAPVIVLCHVPMHYKRKDNKNGANWTDALNYAATGSVDGTEITRNVVFYHGHNHTSEATEYFYLPGSTVSMQGSTSTTSGVSKTIRFTYITAGYMKKPSGVSTVNASLLTIDDDKLTFTKSKSGTTSVLGSVDRVAHEAVTYFAVTFETGEGSAVNSQNVAEGKTPTKPADPTREGFIFDGWYADEACTEPFDFTQPITAATIVYAKWAEDTIVYFTLSFVTNGGSEVPEQRIAEGGTAVRPEDPTRSGYTFEGWYSDEACTELFDFTQPLTANTIIYAKWTEKEVTGLTFAYASTATTDDQYLIVSNGYAMVNNNGTLSAVAVTLDGDEVIIEDETIDEDAILWTVGSDGSLKNGSYYVYRASGTNEASLTLKTSTKSKYTNWSYTGEQLTVVGGQSSNTTYYIYYNSGWKTNTSTSYTAKLYTKVEKPRTITYTVTFNTNGGTAIEPLSVEEGAAATRPADPTREGFTFAGWFSDEELTTEYDFSQTVTEALTLYAKWEALKCATPQLAYSQGKVTCTCATEEVTYRYNVVLNGTEGESTDGIIQIGPTLTVNVKAVRDGYADSDEASISVNIANVGDVNGDGSVTIADVTALVDILLGK